MKRWILSAGILCSLATVADAQTKKGKTGTAKKPVKAQQTTARQTPGKTNTTTPWPGGATTLNVQNNYNAKAPYALPGAAGNLQITDPTVRALHHRSLGHDVPVSSSGIIGMPKSAYGYANGKILFRRTDATTFGTSTGSGAVGTGSSPGALGTGGMLMGVNGKSPNAGPGMYNLPLTDGKEGARPYGQTAKTKE